ncbi:ribosome biogenesis GTPase Der, partial [Streptomyces anulatus]|uniref:ribosome biogenesis GTPase Der n=1 Tax=Streptomyces anulatus TaxID=1892 RepID=UPI0036588574
EATPAPAPPPGRDPRPRPAPRPEAGHGPLPVLAVVGRPNVGKSTLVNRIIGRREAVVQDKPGVTRDRVSYEAEWAGRRFKVVDTGGWEQDVLGLDASVAAQAEYAIETADAVVFVVDSTVGATDTDEAVVKLLRRAGKPVVLCANKVDGQSGEADATALWSLGLGEPYPVSSLHGRGTGDMLDAVLEALPDAPAQKFGTALGGPRRIALIGRPNVGKSSLLNKVAGEDRVVVNEQAGTTRDPVDELIKLGGITWKFIDTAGIRRRVHLQEGADYYASLRTAAAVEKAEVAVVLIDSSESISVQDQRIITMAVEAGRALVVAFNKWDTLDEERRYYLEREIETELAQIAWAPRVNVSALTGRHMEKLVPAIETAIEGWETRVPTGRLNAFLGEIVASHPHPIRGGKQPRILFGTQAGTKPPRFVLFASGFLEHGYRRFVERRLREEFGFEGTPIHISVRVREKRGRNK